MNERNESASLDAYMYDRHSRPLFERPGEPGRAPELTGIPRRIPTADGVSLAATVWDPPGRRRGRVLVIASGTGVKRGYYATFAAWLAARGFAVVTFDYRGMGESRTAAGAAEPSMHEWGELDLAAVLAWAGTALGDGRTAMLGHSVGGQLVGLLPDHARARIGALVTIGSQSGDFRLWPLPARLAMAVLWYGVVPGVTHAVGYLPGALGIGEDLPAGVALEWARWCRTPGYLASEGSRREGFARLDAPVLAYGFDDDPYAPPAAVDALHALFVGAPIERRQLGKDAGRFGHFGFFRSRHEAHWADVTAFLEAQADAD